MGKRLALLAIRLLVSVNLLYAAIFLKFAGLPGSVALFTQISQAVHGLVSHSGFRLGSGAFETVAAILLLIPKTARLAAGLIVVSMTAVILSHIFLLGYGWFFVDALLVMVLASANSANVVEIHQSEDCSVKEVVGLAGISVAATKSRLLRARKILRVLQFLAVAELVESDFWGQYCELAINNPR